MIIFNYNHTYSERSNREDQIYICINVALYCLSKVYQNLFPYVLQLMSSVTQNKTWIYFARKFYAYILSPRKTIFLTNFYHEMMGICIHSQWNLLSTGMQSWISINIIVIIKKKTYINKQHWKSARYFWPIYLNQKFKAAKKNYQFEGIFYQCMCSCRVETYQKWLKSF